MSFISRLAEKTVVAAVDWALARIFGPPSPGAPKKRAPTELSHAAVDHIEDQIDRATAHKVPLRVVPTNRYDD